MDCIFCKIASKELPSDVIYEDSQTLAFLDIHPMTPGHTVIIPKKHAENIIDLSHEGVEPLFSTVKKITTLLSEKLKPEGFTIGINHGRTAGMDHLHVHVVPRYEGDGGGSLHSVVRYSSGESLSDVKKRILG
jgi:histidine triad (HIT) family protein